MLAGAAALSVMGLAASGASGPGPGSGHGFRGPQHRGPGGLFQDARLLDLSDDQRTAVHDLFRQHQDAVRPLMEQERDLHQKLRDAASQEGADPAKVGRIAIDAFKIGEQIRAQRKQMEQAFVGLLTPDQKDMWTKIQASREKQRERHKEGRGFGPRPEGDGPEDAPR
jgi:Spy/CpxP family protein refolding chaperone